MATLSSFVGAMKGGGARANQFAVTIYRPGLNDAHFQFMCRSAQIPAMTIGEVPVAFRGRQIFVPGDRTYDAWTLTVYNDSNYTVRDGFERWSNEMQDIGTSTAASGDYVYRRAVVAQMDRNSRVLRTYALSDCWPTTLDAIDLAYDTNDVIEEFGVTLRFNYMTVAPGAQAKGARQLANTGGIGTGATFTADPSGTQKPNLTD